MANECGLDPNGDGNPDLVLSLPCAADGTCSSDGGVCVLLGNGDGTFQTVANYVGTGTDTVRVGVGDFNGDNIPDVVALNYNTASITVFLGNGDGTLQPGLTFATGMKRLSVAVADFNGDHLTDMAVVSQAPRDVTVLLNAGGSRMVLGK